MSLPPARPLTKTEVEYLSAMFAALDSLGAVDSDQAREQIIFHAVVLSMQDVEQRVSQMIQVMHKVIAKEMSDDQVD